MWTVTPFLRAIVLTCALMAPAEAGVLLQGYYLRSDGSGGERGVPSPADPKDKANVKDFWWDHIAAQAKALREAGFTAVWLPAPTKGASGTSSFGFDVFDDYDLGSKDQKGAIPTRYGTREQLARCVAILRATESTCTWTWWRTSGWGAMAPAGSLSATRTRMGRSPEAVSPRIRATFTIATSPKTLMCLVPTSASVPTWHPLTASRQVGRQTG